MSAPSKFENARSALAYVGRRASKLDDKTPESELSYRGLRKIKSLTCGLCKENVIRSRDELADILTSKHISPNKDTAYRLIDGFLIHDQHNNTVHSSVYASSSGTRKISFGFALLPSKTIPQDEKTKDDKARQPVEYALSFFKLTR